MNTTLNQGANIALPDSHATIEVTWSPARLASCDIDMSAFLLSANNKVRGDADMVFYNQPSAENGAIRMAPGGPGRQSFELVLGNINANVEKISFVLTIHEADKIKAHFGQCQSIQVIISSGSTKCVYQAHDPHRTETALILVECYRYRGAWKIRAVGQGFVGGLGPLATTFGVDVGPTQPTAPIPAPPPASLHVPPPVALGRSGADVRLEKKLVSLQKQAPQLVSLAKQAHVSLAKRKLDSHVASVGLAMDISGSMAEMFIDGTVQSVIEQAMGLGINFDDNGAIDVFAFGSKAHNLGEMHPSSFQTASLAILEGSGGFEGSTNYAPLIQKVLEHYGYPPRPQNKFFGGQKSEMLTAPALHPVYMLFVTDGENFDQEEAVIAIKHASHYPIFFQFIGIGDEQFIFLNKLDDLSGRYLDNANFFHLRNPRAVAPSAFYERMMGEYPSWVAQAKAKNLIRP